MEIFVTTAYVLCDEVLKALEFKDDPQSLMATAEVMAFALLSAKYFSGNHKFTRYISNKLGLFPNILSQSRINRRLHQKPWDIWHAVFRLLAMCFKRESSNQSFAVDSFPVACCQKSRIDKRKILINHKYIGYAASKKQYFCGIKVHMIVTSEGKPIEVVLGPGSESDVVVLWKMELDIPAGSKIYADGAYNSFDLEDILEDEKITLLAKRGSTSKKRTRSQSQEKLISSKRQIVETSFSSITDLFPRNIRFRTEKGFLIKVYCFILAYSTSFFCS